MTSPTIFLVDDDASFLRATARMLRASGYMVTINDSVKEFIADLDVDAAGCVVTDLAMPEMDGFALQERLASLGSTLPVIFLSGQGDIPSTVRAMRDGAEDFLTKNAPRKDLLAAVERALERNERENTERTRLHELRHTFDALSKRELEVLSHVVRGQMNKQIGADLGICERTVKLHRTSITTKLGVHSAAELAVLTREAELFSDPTTTFPKGQ